MEVVLIVSTNEPTICYEKTTWREYIEFINSKSFLYAFTWSRRQWDRIAMNTAMFAQFGHLTPPPLQEPVKITFSEQDFILLRCKNHLEFKYPNRNVWNVLNNLFLPLRPRLFLYDIQPMDLHASWSCSHFTSTNQVDLNFLISLQIFQSSWTRPNVHFMVPLFHYPSLCLASGPPTCNNLSSNLSLKS